MKQLFYFIALVLLISCNNPESQTNASPISEVSTDSIVETKKMKKFPEDFLGIYKGDLIVTNSAGDQIVPMEFQMLATQNKDKYIYKIKYGVEKETRNYNLERTSNPNLFLVDENNGIILESAYANQTLYSIYEVQGNLLQSTEIFYDDRMEFMIGLARVRDTSLTGNEESAKVKNYPLSVMQRATLMKQQDSTATN
ncbi:hypothetical protein [Nonlabens ponticola]|uniref:Uncharacterized protein n=1 Tax=Nonlabens ponticola TaxID=2496866 RepID=A0A3S9MZ28_9FLAO|nr:hypothetical protein [Nonlabens ponticola]AZQ44511.1 hypothetical protein EJ995_09745 [Nonlabens ponticola]